MVESNPLTKKNKEITEIGDDFKLIKKQKMNTNINLQKHKIKKNKLSVIDQAMTQKDSLL